MNILPSLSSCSAAQHFLVRFFDRDGKWWSNLRGTSVAPVARGVCIHHHEGNFPMHGYHNIYVCVYIYICIHTCTWTTYDTKIDWSIQYVWRSNVYLNKTHINLTYIETHDYIDVNDCKCILGVPCNLEYILEFVLCTANQMAMAIIVGPSEPEIFPFLLGKSWDLATFGRMKPRVIPSLITQLQQDSCDFLPNSYLPTVCCVFFPSPEKVAFSHFSQDLNIFF